MSTTTRDPQPTLKVLRLPDGTVRLKLPRKGSRWQGPVRDVHAAVDRAIKEGTPIPFTIDYVEKED